MSKTNSGFKGTLRNILVAGTLGLSVLGGVNQSYAQENTGPHTQKYEDVRKANERARYDIKEARRQCKVLTQRRQDGTLVITHPEYGSIEAKDLSAYISIMANSIRNSEENMKKGISILESEVERGHLSPERAKEAKTALVEAIKDYEIVKAMYGNLNYNPKSPFRREVDFFAPDVREEIIDTDTKKRVPYPTKMIGDFAEFAKKHQLDSETRSGFNRPYGGEVGKPIRKALDELDEVIKKEVQQEIKTRRYVPWSGFGERIDEFIHPGVGDGWEIGLSMITIMALTGSGIRYGFYRFDKREKEKKKGEEQEKKTADNSGPLNLESKDAELEIEVINPWNIKFHNLNSGEKT